MIPGRACGILHTRGSMNNNDGDWSTLRFEEAVLTEFAFLCTEYGFRRANASPSSVQFEGNDVVVNVVQDRSSFEINATVKRKQTGEHFSVWEIARLAGAPDVEERTFLQASTSDRVERLVPVLADTLRRYGALALRGDEAFYSRLRDLQSNESARFLAVGRLAWVREQVRTAWKKQDYGKVVELLDSVREHLSKADTKKLVYARKKLDVR